MMPIFSRYNRTRISKYQIVTNIIKDKEKLVVTKKALSEDAKEHIKNLVDNQNIIQSIIIDDRIKLPNILELNDYFISYEYINGTTYEQLLFKSFYNNNKENFIELLNTYCSIIKTSIKTTNHYNKKNNIFKYFNLNIDQDEINKDENYFYEKGSIDLIFENIIVVGEFYYLIDLEWVFNCFIPVSYQIYRAFFNSFQHKYHDYHLDKFIPINEILKIVDFSAENLEIYENLEKSFQKFVYGENLEILRRYAQEYFPISYNQKKQEEQNLRFAQLFIKMNIGYNESDSIIETIIDNENCLIFDLSGFNHIKGLRFDPLNDFCIVRINYIKIIDLYKKNQVYLEFTTNAVLQKNNVYYFDTKDPIVEINLNDVSRPLKIVIDVEYQTFGDDVFKQLYLDK